MEKNIAHPTDARLYETARRKLVVLAREAGIDLRQTYNRLGPRLCFLSSFVSRATSRAAARSRSLARSQAARQTRSCSG